MPIKAIDNFDAYDYLHHCLHEAFDSFNVNGGLRTLNVARGDVEAALELIEEQFGYRSKINQALKFMRGNLEDYWGFRIAFATSAQSIHNHFPVKFAKRCF